MSNREIKQEKIIFDNEYLALKDEISDSLDLDFIKKSNENKYNKGKYISDELLEEAIYEFYGNKSLIVKNTGLTRQGLYDRIARSEILKEACQNAILQTRELVDSKLMLRIKGYNVIETKVFCHNGQIIKENVVKHYPPDVNAMNTFYQRENIANDQVLSFEDFIKKINIIING